MATTPPQSVCFYQNWNAYRENTISSETRYKNCLDHLFAGVRHAEDLERPEDSVRKEIGYLSNTDIVAAGVMVCMLQEEFRPPLR